jgi:hypothetical protein
MYKTHSVSILSIEHDRLSTEDKVVALGSQCDGDTLAEQHEREHVAILEFKPMSAKTILTRIRDASHLFPAVKEELEGVVAVRDCRANKWDPVEDLWRVGRPLGKDLLPMSFVIRDLD